jgi:hypothetical protein
MGCHEGSFVSDSLEADYAAVKAKITPGNAASSAIFQYAQGGENHPGGEIWAADAPEMIELKAWIESES